MNPSENDLKFTPEKIEQSIVKHHLQQSEMTKYTVCPTGNDPIFNLSTVKTEKNTLFLVGTGAFRNLFLCSKLSKGVEKIKLIIVDDSQYTIKLWRALQHTITEYKETNNFIDKGIDDILKKNRNCLNLGSHSIKMHIEYTMFVFLKVIEVLSYDGLKNLLSECLVIPGRWEDNKLFETIKQYAEQLDSDIVAYASNIFELLDTEMDKSNFIQSILTLNPCALLLSKRKVPIKPIIPELAIVLSKPIDDKKLKKLLEEYTVSEHDVDSWFKKYRTHFIRYFKYSYPPQSISARPIEATSSSSSVLHLKQRYHMKRPKNDDPCTTNLEKSASSKKPWCKRMKN